MLKDCFGIEVSKIEDTSCLSLCLFVLQAENMVTLKMAESDHTEQELELYKHKIVLKEQLVELELSHQEEIKTLRLVSVIYKNYNMKA